ncbi:MULTISPECIES: NAD(P)H-dependent oxidoreductase [unclassified Campylobacter]|uniref:NAD(P)H-dependent oxidoreductase n=1 Tax=unclassified Campylobacter TaxID=2593542 RepID=UPI001475A8D0|nr:MULTISPECIES: NAD(P)H-dependent oxidoreductase [unclassified Campylobacter]QKF91508.1 nitroreductase family protein [Campylobacter sp. CCUG 57310]
MDFLEAMNFRHACKIFDENKKISDDEFGLILEAGRLSPSSTGLEQWDFLVVQNADLRQKIREVSWNQVQMTSCSHLLVILAKISEVKPGNEYIKKIIARRVDKEPELIAQREKFYQDFLTANFKNDDELTYHWSSKQCYIAAANMMTAAATLGIDSCPIEGFDADALNKVLNLDTTKQRVAVMIPFGYRLNPQPPKYRREMSDVVTWIK